MKKEFRIDPNIAGLFEGSYFWGEGREVNLTPFIFQEELIKNINITLHNC